MKELEEIEIEEVVAMEAARKGGSMSSFLAAGKRSLITFLHFSFLISLFSFSALCLMAFASCCKYIDDDLSDCGATFELDYEMRLVTNISTEIETQLPAESDKGIAEALRKHLSGIFTDFAHDVDLSFYDTQGDSLRLHHDKHIMDASEATYTLYLPMREYMHLAAANDVNNAVVDVTNDERCHPSRLETVADRGNPSARTVSDTIASHTTGLFTARLPMDVKAGVDQKFHVLLYMANCAAALVVDPWGHDASKLSVLTTGYATGFNICDSVFTFEGKDPMVETVLVRGENTSEVAFCSVSFPSREPADVENPSARTLTTGAAPGAMTLTTGAQGELTQDGAAVTRTVIETTEPFEAESSDHTLWKFVAYHRNADGTTTKTELGLAKPLRAGQLKIIKGYLKDDGSITTDDMTVGVSVTLDWHQGGEYHPEL